MVEKVAARASILIPRALAGASVAIALPAMAGIAIVAKAIKKSAAQILYSIPLLYGYVRMGEGYIE